MDVCIIGNPDNWHARALKNAFLHLGAAVDAFPITDTKVSCGERAIITTATIKNRSLADYNVIMVRSIPAGSLEQIIFRMNSLHLLELAGVSVLNPAGAIERMVDKSYTSSLLASAGLPTPATIATESFHQAMEAYAELGGDVVVKPLFGSLGRGIVRVESPDVAYRVFRALEMCNYVFYVQQFVPHGNSDIRAIVVGNRVLAAMERKMESTANSWKTNIAQGASASPVYLNSDEEELAVKAAKAVGALYAGVDLVRSDSGELFVLEVNGIPGWRGLQEVCPIDIAGAIATFALNMGGKANESISHSSGG